MTREKKIPGTDINTQESSELPSQGRGVKDPSVQMSKRLRFAFRCNTYYTCNCTKI